MPPPPEKPGVTFRYAMWPLSMMHWTPEVAPLSTVCTSQPKGHTGMEQLLTIVRRGVVEYCARQNTTPEFPIESSNDSKMLRSTTSSSLTINCIMLKGLQSTHRKHGGLSSQKHVHRSMIEKADTFMVEDSNHIDDAFEPLPGVVQQIRIIFVHLRSSHVLISVVDQSH